MSDALRLRPIYAALAPAPDAEYGAAAGTETGQLTDRAIASTIMGGMDAGLGLAPRAAGAARPGMRAPLPMDSESRMARARGMGFLSRKSGEPSTFYHGTNREMSPGLSLTPLGRTTNSESAPIGIWVAESPLAAEEFAEMAAKRPGARQGGGPQTVRMRPPPEYY